MHCNSIKQKQYKLKVALDLIFSLHLIKHNFSLLLCFKYKIKIYTLLHLFYRSKLTPRDYDSFTRAISRQDHREIDSAESIFIYLFICHSYIALMEFCTILVLLPSTVLYKVIRYCCVGILFVVLC